MGKDYYLIFSLLLLFQLVDVSLLFGQGFLINQVKTLETRNALVNKSYSDIEGSPYINNSFFESRLYDNDGNFTDLPLRYDAFQDEMEYVKDGKIRWINKNDISMIKYGRDTVLVRFTDRDHTKSGYFFRTCRGKYSILHREVVTFQPAVPAKGYADGLPDRFHRENDEIFIKLGDNPAISIKKRKDLTNYFNNNKAALDFIKKEKTRPDNLVDLNKLMSYLSRL